MSTQNDNSVPAGYRKDHRGYLVPEEAIKPIDRARDELVMELVSQALPLRDMLAQFKRKALEDCSAFVELSLEQYGVKLGGKKGNTRLESFDGRYKIEICRQDRTSLNEKVKAAEELFDRYLDRLTEGSSRELRKLVMNAFKKDKDGNMRQSEIVRLRSMDIEDDDWQQAMQALNDACYVTGTSVYIRVYERDEEADDWKPVHLSLPAVAV